MKNKKIVILALHLGAGGAEKAICNLANILCMENDVTIISTYKLNDLPAFEINPSVKIEYLLPNLKPNRKEIKSAIKNAKIFTLAKESLKSLKILYLRKKTMVEKIKEHDCDVIISTRILHNNWVGKYAKNGIIKIAEEHNSHNNNKKYIKKLVKSLKNIDYLMPTSKGLSDFYEGKIGNTKVKFIPNYIERKTDKVSNLENKTIISVGRLEPVKGFDDLIDVFEIFQEKNPDWNLKIIGSGSQKEALKNKINSLNLQNKVLLLGELTTEKVEEEYSNSSIYVMTSHSESLGLVLIEAASAGLPLFAFDSCDGPKEIIQSGENGYLIPNRDKKQMAEKIAKTIENKQEMQRLSNNAKKILEKYSKEKVQKEWSEFLENL